MYQLGRMLTRSTFLVIFSISCFSHTITTFSEFGEDSKNTSENYFIVTAYYSPVENQEDYITGSYEGDIRLNGSGNRGASGKEVFPGMIAAPKNYLFGTKIYIAGFGTGSVEDRGGSIIEATNRGPSHDRLDVWMGFGDDGRKRAVLWGARKVPGHVVDSSSEIAVQFSSLHGLEAFGGTIGPNSNEENIKKLQEFLISLKMYSGLVDGNHNSIRDTIIDYQLKHTIIQSRDDEEAGYFGPKTIAKIKKEFPTATLKPKSIVVKEANQHKQSVSKFSSALEKDINTYSSKSDIQKLQLLLTHIGLYKGKIDGGYDQIRPLLTKYQIKRKIITDKNQTGAGNFGPKTREYIKKDFQSLLLKSDTEFINLNTSVLKVPQVNIGPDSSKEDIKLLQSFMNSLNIYGGSIDGKYESIKNTLIQYQLKSGIIENKTDDSAGYFGPKTRDKMKKEVRELAKK